MTFVNTNPSNFLGDGSLQNASTVYLTMQIWVTDKETCAWYVSLLFLRSSLVKLAETESLLQFQLQLFLL